MSRPRATSRSSWVWPRLELAACSSVVVTAAAAMMAYFANMRRARVSLALTFALAGAVSLVAGACRSGARASDGGGGAARSAALSASQSGVVIRLERLHPGDGVIVFGVPVARGALADTARVRVRDPRSREAIAGAALAASLHFHDASGKRTGV